MGKLWPATKSEDEPASITYESIQKHIQSYPSHIPPNLRVLDSQRQQAIPDKVEQRRKAGDTFLDKDDVTTLVDLKLKYGTYRPNLAKLVASNSDKDIISIIKSAFKAYSESKDEYKNAIETLSVLKGVGPATASLFLSCCDPTEVPFFSDPLYRYVFWKRANGQGWDRKIKYTLKEYKEMFGKVQLLRKRLQKESGKSVSAIDLEKAAYVLAKEAQPNLEQHPVEESDIDQENGIQPPRPIKKRKGAAAEDKSLEEEDKQEPKQKRRKKTTVEDSKKNDVPNSTSKPKNKKSNAPKLKKDSSNSFDRQEECLRKGPHGSPTYDTMGFELDYAYLLKASQPGPSKSSWNAKASQHFEQQKNNRAKKAEIIGAKESSCNFSNENMWDDMVARDLGLAFHEVGMEEYEEWQRRGFKAQVKEHKDLSEQEVKRLRDLATGSALRKGSKRR